MDRGREANRKDEKEKIVNLDDSITNLDADDEKKEESQRNIAPRKLASSPNKSGDKQEDNPDATKNEVKSNPDEGS